MNKDKEKLQILKNKLEGKKNEVKNPLIKKAIQDRIDVVKGGKNIIK